ncbi:MAG: YraN family protein [Planctomycetota bacterium]|nr:YraN family protein [Planctomycetota bacterium]
MSGLIRKLLGDRGERAAAKYLRREKRMRILARQFSTRWGELDLICLDGDTMVFVEVKTRKSDEHGHPAEAVTLKKQQNLTKAALFWLKKKGLLENRARFDVVSIVWPEGEKTPIIEHIVNAFAAADLGQMF